MRSRRQDIRRVWYGDSGTTYVEGLLNNGKQRIFKEMIFIFDKNDFKKEKMAQSEIQV